MFRLMSNPKSTHYNPDVAKALKDAAGKDDEQKTSVKDGDKKKKGRGGGSAGQKEKRKSRSKAKKGKGKGKGRGKKRPRDGEDDDEDEDADGLEDDDAEDTACLHHHFRVKSKHLLFNFAPVQILTTRVFRNPMASLMRRALKTPRMTWTTRKRKIRFDGHMAGSKF